MAVVSASALRAEDKPEFDFAKFEIFSVTLETELKDFKKRYPKSKRISGDPYFGTAVYEQKNPTPGGILKVEFLDGRPMAVHGTWMDEAFYKIGGFKTVLDKLKDKYGEGRVVKQENPFEVHWWDKSDKRLLVYRHVDGEDLTPSSSWKVTVLAVINSELVEKLEEREKKKLGKNGEAKHAEPSAAADGS